jgi:hypothetical protein
MTFSAAAMAGLAAGSVAAAIIAILVCAWLASVARDIGSQRWSMVLAQVTTAGIGAAVGFCAACVLYFTEPNTYSDPIDAQALFRGLSLIGVIVGAGVAPILRLTLLTEAAEQ